MITFRKTITPARLFIAVSGFCGIATTCHSSVLRSLLYFTVKGYPAKKYVPVPGLVDLSGFLPLRSGAEPAAIP